MYKHLIVLFLWKVKQQEDLLGNNNRTKANRYVYIHTHFTLCRSNYAQRV